MKLHAPPFRLKEMKIEITHKCGLNCIHCSSFASHFNNATIDTSLCLRILDEGAALGVDKIAFSGGEPLLSPSIDNFVKKAALNKTEVSIYTSGNVNNFNKIIDKLKLLGLTKAIFSLYSQDFTKHEAISRMPGSFLETVSSIKHSKEIGLKTELHFVPFLSNYQELQSLATFGESLGVEYISVLRFVPQGRGKEILSQKLNICQNKFLKNDIEDLKQKGYKIRTGSPYNFLLLNNQPQCCAAIDRLTITPDLRIYPCDAFKRIFAENLVGTAEYSCLDNYSLEECWLYSPYLNAVRDYLTSDFPERCQACTSLNYCLSGCLAQKVVITGNLEKRPDPDCLFI